jgi:hypothetical protein
MRPAIITWVVVTTGIVWGAALLACYHAGQPPACVCECKAPDAQLRLGGKAQVYDDLILDPELLPNGAIIYHGRDGETINLTGQEPEYGEPVKCGICGKTYRKQLGVTMMCAVNHQPGSCCHYGDLEVIP